MTRYSYLARMDFALTITLQPNNFKLPVEEQYDALLAEIIDDVIGEDVKLSLITELTNAHNVHAHGIIRVNSKGKARSYLSYIYNLFRNRKTIGFIKAKEMGDREGWLEYCTKCSEETSNHIDRPIVIIDELNVLDHLNTRSITSVCPCL